MFVSLALLLIAAVPAVAQETVPGAATARIGYLTQTVDELPPLSLVDPPTEDSGLLGARLGIEDNNTTGKFTGQNFVLERSRGGRRTATSPRRFAISMARATVSSSSTCRRANC